MFDMPVSFRLDTEGIVLENLSEDAPVVIMDLALDAVGQTWARPIEGCAELIVPVQESREDEYIHQAFCVAGFLACQAFFYSDAPDDLKHATLKHMSLAAMPASILHESQPLTGLSKVAREGHAKHPEFKEHTNFVMEYYCATTQRTDIAKTAFCGAGVALYQLENAWIKARDRKAACVAAEVASSTSWDSFPWDD